MRAMRAMSALPVLLAAVLRVGVTLHPYYSWTSNVGGTAVVVVPIVPPSADPHSFQPRPEDVAVLSSLDAVVENGLGHDAFLEPMLRAAGKERLPLLLPNENVPLLPGASGGANSHSFLSITASSQQIQNLAKELGHLDPPHAELYTENARVYVRRLRGLLADALRRLEGKDLSRVHIATVHDGYGYLFSELGLRVEAVVQARHGVEPSARQLADTIERIKAAHVNLLFTELGLDRSYVETIEKESGCRLRRLTHIAGGPYTPERFEKDMKANLDAIVDGVGAAAGGS